MCQEHCLLFLPRLYVVAMNCCSDHSCLLMVMCFCCVSDILFDWNSMYNFVFAAPEILNYEPLSCASDMWSIGAMTYAL